MLTIFTVIPINSTYFFFFFNDTATTEIYTLSLHDALPIWDRPPLPGEERHPHPLPGRSDSEGRSVGGRDHLRSEEHTSELQSQSNLVCRLLLEKKKTRTASHTIVSPHSLHTNCTTHAHGDL